MQLIIGLGNPGEDYAATRHNIGRMVVLQAAVRWRIPLHHSRLAHQGTGHLASHPLLVALPHSWMNQSGVFVRDLLSESAIGVENLVVVHDDLDLDFGTLRIRLKGGAGGHNGIHSLIFSLETEQFCRLKVGIGRPPAGQDPAEYVLSPFSVEESHQMGSLLARAVEALESLIVEGAPKAMNRFNIRQAEA
ncbi:MAG: aminoacyl-tRNA hydrolase [Nitrospirota bacterium]|nr:MAG: aminoacyl-tRNA hydrolase [Nitrospirota bacterium]